MRIFPSAMRVVVLSAALVFASSAALAQTHKSDLWGEAGERWTPDSRLPDFSYAGYHAGERPIPTPPVKASVKEFGARGDGETDDTKALQDAIDATAGGALEIPPGRYKIAGILEIRKSNLVLRGAGPDATVLYFPKPLSELMENVPYFDGLLRIGGQRGGQQLARVVERAERGDRRLRLDSTTGIGPGQLVRLKMSNPADNSLGRHLYGEQGALNAERRKWYSEVDPFQHLAGQPGALEERPSAGHIIDWVVPVQAIEGDSVILTRPLRHDIRRAWAPQIWSYHPTVQEVGVENLAIEFPKAPYRGHWKEAGYYAIYITDALNCWVRNVTITDADICMALRGAVHNTITGATLKADARVVEHDKVDQATGHYGFAISGAGTQDNLVTNCDLQTSYVHNLQVANFTSGNVYSSITTMSGRFDHHGAAPFDNLYTDILIRQRAGDLFKCGGNRKDEPSSGMHATFWNIRAAGSFPPMIPTLPDGKPKFPLMNLVGLDAWQTDQNADGIWIESWPGETTRPDNLHQAQLARRRCDEGQ